MSPATRRTLAPPPLPVGGTLLWRVATPPDGWLLCEGQAVSRTTYAALFALLGTADGAGDGTTTFNLPDMRGAVPMGHAASGTGSTLGGTGGSRDHTHDNHVSSNVGIIGVLSPAHTAPTTHAAANQAFKAWKFIIKAL